MLVVDVVLIVLLVVSAIVGLRRGLLASVGLFAGIALGAAVAYWLMPLAGSWVSDPSWRLVTVISVGIGLLLLGAAVGSAIGRSLRRGVDRIKLRVPERILGGLASFVGAALLSLCVRSASGGRGIDAVRVSKQVRIERVVRVKPDISPQFQGKLLDLGFLHDYCSRLARTRRSVA